MQLLDFRPNDTHEFRPILAEIEDEPTNPVARAAFWLTFSTAVFFIAWSVFGEVDVVVTAPGKVIPEGHAKLLQPLETGVISRILVKEGDRVKRGQPLIEIDPSINADELRASQANYMHTRLEMSRIESALTGRAFGGGSGTQAALHDSSVLSMNRQLESKQQELERVRQQYKQAEAELEKNQTLLKHAEEKHNRLEPVLDLIARDEWDRNESDITTYTGNIAEQQSKLTEYLHQQQQLSAEVDRIRFDFQTTNLQDLSEKEKQATDLDAEVRKLSFKQKKQLLVAPSNGFVDQMYVHTVGGIVSSGEKLLSIVPAEQRMMVQASLPNRDVGFVRVGMETQLKVDTFDFQKYGMFEGRVVLISSDSHDNEAKQMVTDRDQTEKKLEQVFEVYVEPTTKYLMVEGKQQTLQPGMTLTAEIKTGKRRIIEFFIYPLIKYWHNGITVR